MISWFSKSKKMNEKQIFIVLCLIYYHVLWWYAEVILFPDYFLFIFSGEKVNTIFHCKVGNWRWNIESWHLKNQFNSTFSEQCKIGLFLSQNHFVYPRRIRCTGCQYFRVAQDKVCIPYKNKTFPLRHIFDDSSM